MHETLHKCRHVPDREAGDDLRPNGRMSLIPSSLVNAISKTQVHVAVPFFQHGSSVLLVTVATPMRVSVLCSSSTESRNERIPGKGLYCTRHRTTGANDTELEERHCSVSINSSQSKHLMDQVLIAAVINHPYTAKREKDSSNSLI
jgi:hypothetical protein